MTLKELETWLAVTRKGLPRSAQAADRRGFYHAVAIKGAKESRDRARWHLAAADLLASLERNDHASRRAEEAHRTV
jgi:hypothetical protein